MAGDDGGGGGGGGDDQGAPKGDAAGGGQAPPLERKMSEDDVRKYVKGSDIRRKIDVQEGDGWKLLDRYTLEFGDKVFKAKQQVKWKDEVYDLQRIRMVKGNPVLMIDK